MPEQSVASSGAIQTNNEMSLTLLSGTRNDNKDDTPIIGMPFFSSAYLMVDLDASTFTLWQANMTDNSNLIAIGADAGCTHSPPVSTNSTIDDAPPASSDEEALDNDQGSQDLGTGAVAGAAIGGLAAVIMLVVLAYFIIRRCRRQSKSGTVASDDTGASGQRMWDGHQRVDYDAYRYAGQYSEMPNEATRMEMSATQLHPHEIDSRQKMAELSHARFDNPVEMSSVQTPKLRPSRPR